MHCQVEGTTQMLIQIHINRLAILMGLIIALGGCQAFDNRPAISDFDGPHFLDQADIEADRKSLSGILATFYLADGALRRGDLDGVMALYAQNYHSHDHNKVALRAAWGHLMESYRDFSATHMFSRIQVNAQKTTAQLTCTGSLWAISKKTGQRENIDSWFEEVHILVMENGRWRMEGHAWDGRAIKEKSLESSPHPFF
jgi:hypothetical protein